MTDAAEKTRPMLLFDTRTREKREFTPQDPRRVTIYACGPTVYGLVHIGNARSTVVFDLLYRVLTARFGRVDYVRNITDIDDKIIAAARESGKPTHELTQGFTAAFEEDMKALGCLEPTHVPHATEYIKQMIQCIQGLIANGSAYVAEGHALFHVPSWSDYGSLSRRNPEEQLAGARVDPAPYKRDPKDFVLWKPSSDHEPGWDSPWGRGRPGWHIECSAMSLDLLGFPLDIHGGGSDLVFPHHENERAQSICLHGGKQEFARFWMHNGMLTLGAEKMAKSRGNIKTVRDLLAEHSGETLRYALLTAHYRGPLAFSDELLKNSRTALYRLYESLVEDDQVPGDEHEGEVADELWQALLDDLNTPRALATLNNLAREINKVGARQASPNSNASAVAHQRKTLLAGGRLLGLMSGQAIEAYLDATRTIDQEVLDRLRIRDEARGEKDFATADAIRDELISQGYEVYDMGAAPSRAVKKL